MRELTRFGWTIAIVAALNSVGWAGDAWFDADIANYGSWPAGGYDKEVVGAGVWRGTSYADLVGEPGAKSLLVSTPIEDRLTFAIDNVQKVSSDSVTVRMSAEISLVDMNEAMPCPDADAKCALTAVVVDESGAVVYCGLAKDPNGETNAWIRLAGAEPVQGRAVDLSFDFRSEAGVDQVRYSVDGAVLRDGAGREWLPIVFVGENADRVSSVLYCGDGRVCSLRGEMAQEAVRIALTIPALEHMTVRAVTANGAPVERTAGVWPVPQGSIVVVRFEAEDGYALTSSSMKFRAGDEAMVLPSDGRPSAVEVSYDVVINEIMAKNSSTLRTAKGFPGLDWVELANFGDEDADLTGWYFGNDPTKKTSKWTQIEGPCVVPAHGYKILWCDGDGLCTVWGDDEAHVACNISTDANKHTLFLSPKADAAKIVEQITLPAQVKDVSFGLGRLEHDLLGSKDVAQYRAGEGDWKRTTGPVGMSAASSGDDGFRVTAYRLDRQLTSVDVALAAVHDQAWKSGTRPVEQAGVAKIAYRTSDQTVKFPAADYTSFPAETGDLAMVVRGTVVVPESGLWTFAVGSDDGFRLTLANAESSYSMEHTGTRGYGVTLSAFSMDAGAYDLELVYFDRSSGAALDLSVAQGDYTTVESGGFSAATFRLVGAADCPLLFGGALAGRIAADVKDEMLGRSRTLEWKASFAVTADNLPAAEDAVWLKVRYADGIVARLNGEEIARTEVSARTPAEALVPVAFAIDPALVRGENVLEITVTNDRIDDAELFLEAQVVLEKAESEFCYFREPTPGKANATHGFGAMTPAVAFSEKHGYKTGPFELTLSCADAPSAPIYYTLDGTSPTEDSTLYTGPIAVSKTTCIRAAVPRDNAILQVDCSATYLFLEDIFKQSPDVVPAGFPANKAVNNHAMRYGFSAAGLAADPERLRSAFLDSIATISIVVDPKDLFDKKRGIYVNPSGDGRAWERPMMLEQINPTGDDGFSVPAGIRIRGAASRGVNYAKHSFRFFFRNEYGMGSLDYPLFGDEGADEFDKVDLRCSQNYSWANDNSLNETFVHECFSRDTQGAMGDYYTRSRYCHLFINGQYWGLYQTQERGDEDFARTYNGGASENYDVIKTSSPNYVTGASEGTDEAWRSLWSLIVEPPDGERNYRRAMGLNEDGTRNPNYPVLLNPTNLVDFVLNFHFVCDCDSPIGTGGYVNNLYAVRNRVDGDGRIDGFYFLRHDAEHSMGVRNEAKATIDPTVYGTDYVNPNGTTSLLYGSAWKGYSNRFSPAELFWRLTKNDEFRLLVADLYYTHLLKDGGALTAPVAKARFERRMAEIDSAIVAESARWSQDRNKPWSYKSWKDACDGRLKFIEDRGPIMLRQYRNRGWYPSVDVPEPVNALGETVADGATFGADERLYLAGGEQGKVYYTTDGSDPRLADDAIEYSEGLAVPAQGLRIAMRVLSDTGEWSALNTVSVKGERTTPKVEGDGFLFRLAGEYAEPVEIAPTGVTCRVVLDGATAPGLVLRGAAEFALVLSNENSVASLSAEAARVTVEGDGALRFEGANTLVSVLDLTVSSGTFAVKSTGVSAAKTPVVNVLGNVRQTGGTIDVDLDVATDLQIYGIYIASKDMKAEFSGGTLAAKVGGTKSAAIYGEKGSVNPAFSGDIAVSAVLTGPQARFVNAAGKIRISGGTFDISMPQDCDMLVDARVFKAGSADKVKAIEISGGTIMVAALAPGSEILSVDGTLDVKGGVLSLQAADDCLSATGDIEISGGIVHALSTAGDAIDSNGSVTIAGGRVFAFTLSSDHDAIDVDPNQTESSSDTHSIVIGDGATVVAVGGEQGRFHAPDEGSAAAVFAEKGLTSSKKYVELTGVLAGDGAQTTTVLSVNWNKRHAGTFTLIAAMPGYDGRGYAETNGKPTETYPNAYKLNDNIDGVFLRDTVEPLKPADWPEDPDAEITGETKPSDLGITDGAFAEATTEELRKLARWAKAKGVAFGDRAVNAMAFDADGNPATFFEEAYLLGCEPTEDAVAAAKARFRFDTVMPGEIPTIEGDFNGRVEVFGSSDLKTWGVPDEGSQRFFRAKLMR